MDYRRVIFLELMKNLSQSKNTLFSPRLFGMNQQESHLYFCFEVHTVIARPSYQFRYFKHSL